MKFESLLQDAALCSADDLLRRLAEWDAMNTAPFAGDSAYWQREIKRVRAEIAKAMAE